MDNSFAMVSVEAFALPFYPDGNETWHCVESSVLAREQVRVSADLSLVLIVAGTFGNWAYWLPLKEVHSPSWRESLLSDPCYVA